MSNERVVPRPAPSSFPRPDLAVGSPRPLPSNETVRPPIPDAVLVTIPPGRRLVPQSAERVGRAPGPGDHATEPARRLARLALTRELRSRVLGTRGRGGSRMAAPPLGTAGGLASRAPSGGRPDDDNQRAMSTVGDGGKSQLLGIHLGAPSLTYS